jgi:two-component system, OmpR family, alkaline phosphatase synthesis response regulator PhoP
MEDKKYILLVDDEEDFAKVVRIYFERSGFELGWASSGRKALKAIGSRLPDVMILDVMMPKMNGVEVCRDIRAKMGLRRLPIIVLSAFPNEDVKKEILSLGADLYLTKPIGMEALVDDVKSVIPRST